MWTWSRGGRRHRAERAVTAKLVTGAVLAIRSYAVRGEPGDLERIRLLADVVHNLPGGILGGGERRPEPYGYHTFRWMWDTASPRQREWLIAHFDALGYDYGYLDLPPSPPPREEIHRSWSARRITTAALAGLDAGCSWASSEIRHADPEATHVLMPRGRDRPHFQPAEPGIAEYDCLLRMADGETIIVHLRLPTAVFDALTGRRRFHRWVTPARDGYLWERDHAAEDCPTCATAESDPRHHQ